MLQLSCRTAVGLQSWPFTATAIAAPVRGFRELSLTSTPLVASSSCKLRLLAPRIAWPFWHSRTRFAALSALAASTAASWAMGKPCRLRHSSRTTLCSGAGVSSGTATDAEARKAEASVVELKVEDQCCSKAPHSTPLVVLVHGLDSWSGTWGSTMQGLAARGIPSVAVDLRGCGFSPLGKPEDFGPTQLAADVRAALQQQSGNWCGSRRVILVGHSMGGKLVLKYASLFPQDLAAVVVEDMDCTCRSYSKEYLECNAKEIDRKKCFSRSFPSWEACRKAMISFGYDAERVDGWRGERVLTAHGGYWSAVNPYAQWLARKTVLATDDAYMALQRLAVIRANERTDLSVHVLVAGDAGTVCYWDALPGGIRDMESVLPGLAVSTFPAAGHSIHNSDTAAFLDILDAVVAAAMGK